MLDSHAPIITETAPPMSPFDDPECAYLAMPDAMRTFSAPSLHGTLDNAQGRAILQQLADSLKTSQTATIDLCQHTTETCGFVEQILGEGEISILADRPSERLLINEAVFAGVWRVRRFNDGILVRNYLETGACPRLLLEWAERRESQPNLPTHFPDVLMNAPSLLHELFAKSRGFSPGKEEVINLTLLPLTPEDMAFVVDSLQLAGLSVLARGYGDCRVRQTGLLNVWWVQYFNSPGQLILNTLEITGLPKVVLAAPEDLEDSAERLGEVLFSFSQS